MYRVTFYDHLAAPYTKTLSAMNDHTARKEAFNLYMNDGKEPYMQEGFKTDFSKGFTISDPSGDVIHHFIAGVEAV